MADQVEIKIDTTSARLKLERVTPNVRNALRQALPPLARRIGASVNAKLDSELKTRTSLNVAQELHESVNEIYAVVSLQSPSARGLLPSYLEEGTSPHSIVGNPVLAFQWDFMGAYGGGPTAYTTMAFFRSVKHPGTRAYHFMSRTFAEMQSEIVGQVTEAAKAGAKQT